MQVFQFLRVILHLLLDSATHQKGMQTRKKELHAFVYVADNVYINARRLVSPMCVYIQKSETAKFMACFFIATAEKLSPYAPGHNI